MLYSITEILIYLVLAVMLGAFACWRVMRKNHNEDMYKLQQEKRTGEQQVREETAELNKQLSEARQAKARLEQLLADSESEHAGVADGIKQALHEKEVALKGVQDRLSEKNADLMAREKELESLRTDLSNKSNEIDVMSETLDNQSRERQALLGNLNSRDATIHRLSSELEISKTAVRETSGLQLRLDETKKALAEAYEKIKRLEQALASLAPEAGGVQSDLPLKQSNILPFEDGRPEAARTSGGDAPGIPGTRPPALPEPAGGHDNLCWINGIRPDLRDQLQAQGIYSFEQIAQWTEGHVRWLAHRLDLGDRISRENWITQARMLTAVGEGDVNQPSGGSATRE